VALEIIMPRLSDSMEEGTILRWLIAEGDRVKAGQPLVEIETDKANITYEATTAGVILALSVSEGASVPVGAPIAVVGEAGEELPSGSSTEMIGAAGARDAEPREAVGAGDAEPREAVGAGDAEPREAVGAAVAGDIRDAVSAPVARDVRPDRPRASPLARRIAAELDVDLAGLAGSGPQGRVIRADVERAVAAANGAPPATVGAPASTAAKGQPSVQELTRLQRTIARRMAESRATVPDIELRNEVDMSEVVALRERLREVSDRPPSFNDFIVKAAALALRESPRVNGAYRDGRFEAYPRVNVGIAVAAEDALVVPTIFDADSKSLREIGTVAQALAARVRDGSIAPSELSGGTFTVSNLGMYGVDSFSAVINPPQSAILAVGSLRPRAVVDESGQVVARPTILLTLACDHRILYGADGARFLARVRELLERPLALLL
jgi:pyruvate dehydrogenase E2 component (dihydrolipoamide acetyltransferase)